MYHYGICFARCAMSCVRVCMSTFKLAIFQRWLHLACKILMMGSSYHYTYLFLLDKTCKSRVCLFVGEISLFVLQGRSHACYIPRYMLDTCRISPRWVQSRVVLYTHMFGEGNSPMLFLAGCWNHGIILNVKEDTLTKHLSI